MSDIDSAAAAMGVPPELVSRSAAARAQASGTTTEDVLAAWSGGGSVVTAPAPEPDAPAEEPAAEEESAPTPEPTQAVPDPVPAEVAAQTAPVSAAPTPTGAPPVLVGVTDNPWTVAVGAVAIFLAVVLLGLVGPSIPVDEPGARTSAIDFSEQGEAGLDLYRSLGCVSCHTQMVRPVVADVGLGPVTLSDTNQVLGTRRYGPDLADVGSRLSATQMESIINGGGGHPGHDLSDDDMTNLLAFLLESAPGGGN